ncbi:MAG TPA: patatin-like phospholipase family protein, partial [Verrucomicrobiae bacterium]|nr:patatin-like phospholipase family protein [Verrucomicrobiae bacterium]
KKPKILVLSGGSMRGIAIVGVLQGLEELELLSEVKTYAGTSIGAFISMLLVLGYKPSEMFEFIKKFKFEKLKKLEPVYLFTSFGADKGERVEFMIKNLIKKKMGRDNITLSELFKLTNKKLIVTSTCLNEDKICYFSHLNEPDLPVHLAVRMSMCIPLMYMPIFYKGHYYLDGGCKDNYPIGIFRKKLKNVLGVCLCQKATTTNNIFEFEDFITRLLFCIINNSVRDVELYKNHSIVVNITNVGIFDFNMSLEKKIELFNTGYKSALEHFQK